MANIDLTQQEADALIAMEKHRINEDTNNFPDMGGRLTIPLASPDKSETFVLDVYRGRIDLAKVTFQNRARRAVILVRLDLWGPAHQNPDGTPVPCPHLHLYREGFGDKWACAVPAERFTNLDDAGLTLEQFMRYCSITRPPNIQRGLFT